MSQTIVIVSVDTEGDHWTATRDRSAVENVRQLPALQSRCDRLRVPLTYFTTYQVAATPWAAGLLRDLRASGRAEIGAHLHPWNTPPLDEPFLPQYTMTKNLPLAIQRAKLTTLTDTLEAGIGVRARSFRAGRFGFGRETAQVLIELGYLVDCSVTPWTSWEDTDEGADFVGAPLSAYTLDGTTDVRDPVPGGALVEIPLSWGYTRWPFRTWHSVSEALRAPWARPLRLAGIAASVGLVRPVQLNPEVSSVSDMLRLAKLLVGHGVSHLSVFIHSPSLVPGLSPFVRTEAELQRLSAALAEFVDGLGRFTTPVFTTASGATSLLRTRSLSAGTDSSVEEDRGRAQVRVACVAAPSTAATLPPRPGVAVSRVLLVETNEDGTVGGSHRCLHDLAVHLDRSRHTPVCLFYERNWISDRLARAGVEVLDWTAVRAKERQLLSRPGVWSRGLARLGVVKRRARYLKRAHIDLVHLNNSPSDGDLEWVPAAVVAHVPVIAHARCHVLPARRRAVSLIYRAYRRVVAISTNVQQSVVAAGFAPSRVELINDGIDVAALRAAAAGQSSLLRCEFQLAEGDILGVMVGHLKEWKGQHVVLDALRRLPEAVRQRLRFVFVGGFPSDGVEYVDRLTRLTSEWGLANRVRFVGERQDVPAIMAASDLLVHASTIPEPFGLVVAEGMALGKPLIASCLGGPSEIITPGSGLLFDPACPDELATLLERLAGDPEERQRLGEAARVRAGDFDIRRNVAALEDLYERVLSGRRP